ncbi:uncharacterized protein [Rutidosis leptorrhynchoides]|uniref:uncharacterized protein n=1 Tax=Rutidosis leptorrhynchoides TaxID=125765 RepID=UPI003A997692
MNKEDFELENENFNTALYLAVVAGNLGMVKIMVEKNRNAMIIPGANRSMMPLYAAALFGNYDVVMYLFDNSNDLREDGWTDTNRGWLLEKCVENDMFDVAQMIVDMYPKLSTTAGALAILAGKREAFPETKSNFITRTIKSVSASIGLKVGVQEKESKALKLLRTLWENIAKMPKKEIEKLLRGKADSVKNDESGRLVKAIQLQNLIHEYRKSLVDGSMDILKALPAAATGKGDQALKLEKHISKQLVKMHVETQNICGGPLVSNTQDKTNVYGKGDKALELRKIIFEHIVKMHDETQQIIKNSEKADKGPLLLQLIVKRTNSLDGETKKILNGTPKETYSSRILFIAAEMGNTTFLVELIRRYPDLIWKVNDNNQTIFHIAVKHRQEGIYNLLYEIGSMKDMITPLKDQQNNNMLHLVGKIAKQKQLEDVSGVALQMQRELLWFKEVKSMIPHSYRERKNEDGLTPHELFTQEHKELVTLGEQWMKDTASQCMVVAALIATMVFAAAFTIPGGYDQNTGIPMFRSKPTLVAFVVADAISLFSSSASILMFLSILTSRYAERDFLESLPNKLMLGLATLFLSITTMTLAFGVSFFALYNKGFLWIPILIGVFAVMPVFLYIKLQFSLFVDVIRSTYGSRYLFKPAKQVLYFENPKV